MAPSLVSRLVINHLANGNLGESLCLVCLNPLIEGYENIFTKVCKGNQEYCIADILETVCQIKVEETEDYNVCVDCFVNASSAYKFYLTAKRSEEIILFHTEQLLTSIDNINIPSKMTNTLCISLSEIEPLTPIFDFNLEGIGLEDAKPEYESINSIEVKMEPVDEELVLVIEDNGDKTFFKLEEGQLIPLEQKQKKEITTKEAKVKGARERKVRKKRKPMDYKECSQCPVKYRFVSKLKEHMKHDHNIDLFICKVCKSMTEDEEEHQAHIETHSNVHQCDLCTKVFMKRRSIVKHLQWHESLRSMQNSELAHICEVCGEVVCGEEAMQAHWNEKHKKKYTCHYCGRLYKAEVSLEAHLRRHEIHINMKKQQLSSHLKSEDRKSSKPRCRCATCGRDFVDERSLMWHQRLHTDERPYICDVCGRGFISVNRRNQHALCAHTAPTKRCPLCPALFHLRSMVNTHIKKVHLKSHKRRNRSSKYQNVSWRTSPVPLQELSVDVQTEILDLDHSATLNNHNTNFWSPLVAIKEEH